MKNKETPVLCNELCIDEVCENGLCDCYNREVHPLNKKEKMESKFVTSGKAAWYVAVIFIVLAILFGGCQESTVKAVPTTIVIEGISVDKYWIDSCLYFGRNIGSNTGVFTHAGTCPNPIHKCKCN